MKKFKSDKLREECGVFGISNHDTFSKACEYANGAIIGSAFIRHLEREGVDRISAFTSQILGS